MNLNVLLAVVGSLLGLLVTGISIYTALMIHQLWKRQIVANQAEVMESASKLPPVFNPFAVRDPAQSHSASMRSTSTQHGGQLTASSKHEQPVTPAAVIGRYFSAWTVMDYGMLGLFAIGMLLLGADLLAVMRDRAEFPDYHFAYLLCGIMFSFMAMLLLLIRLVAVLNLGGLQRPVPPHHHDEPSHTNQAEQWIERG
jgi:hypothetical protein